MSYTQVYIKLTKALLTVRMYSRVDLSLYTRALTHCPLDKMLNYVSLYYSLAQASVELCNANN